MGNYLSLEQSQEKRAARMDVAGGQSDEAARLAADAGLTLIRQTEVHYQLYPKGCRWLLNIYPSNRRLYRDPNKPEKVPFLRIPDRWTLLDVVRAACEKRARES